MTFKVIHKINSILQDVLGIQFTRIERKEITQLYRITPNRELYVEFIGISGVGKTTLYSKWRENMRKGLTWIGADDYINLFKSKSTVKPANNFYQVIIDKKYELYKDKKYDLPTTLRLMRFFFKKIEEEIFITETNLNYTVAMEDGIFHCFEDCLINLNKTHRKEVEKLLKNRICIYCYADPKDIVNHIGKRKQIINRLLPQHRNKNREQLLAFVKNAIQEEQVFLALLQSLNVPILKIKTTDNPEENIKRIDEFVTMHQY